jgi:hypothetical protein
MTEKDDRFNWSKEQITITLPKEKKKEETNKPKEE